MPTNGPVLLSFLIIIVVGYALGIAYAFTFSNADDWYVFQKEVYE